MNAGKNDVLHNLSAFSDAISSGTEALRNAVKAKQNAEILDKLPPKVLKRVDVLKQIQSEQDELKAKYLEERRALEEKYQKLYQPLYTKRYDIVNGVAEVDGVEGVSDELADQVDEKPAEEKGVPSFWLIAMKTNIVLGDWIQKHDEEALKYLKDIKWCRIEVPKDNNKKVEATEGFKLEFFFDTNPFFKNSVLTKTYLLVDEDVPVLERAIGTEIEWFPGKCLTEILKKPKKGSKNAQPITETETLDSFFNFFTPPEVLDDEEEIEDDVADELESLMEQDYDVGLTIRNRIIPHAVTWFTGEAALYEMSGDLEDEDDDDDDDEDEREDNKEEEDEDEDEAEDDEDEDDDDDEDDEDEDEDEGDEDDKKTSSQKKAQEKRSRRLKSHQNASNSDWFGLWGIDV